MARDVDERKKRAALRKLRKAAELAEQGLGPPLSDWEVSFLEEVEERIEKYGSAFADPEKGGDGEALSALQRVKLKEIDKKARGKGRSGFSNKKRKDNGFKPRVRDIHDEIEDDTPSTPPEPPPSPPRPTKRSLKIVPESPLNTPATPAQPPASEAPSPPKPPENPEKKPIFRVIEGGLKKTET